MERHVSSFFQGYGSRPLRLKEVENKLETIIYKYTIEELQKQFIPELNDRTLIGFPESMHDICKELQINVKELTYNKKRQLGYYETESIKLYLYRFDILVKHFESLLTKLTGIKIVTKSANQSWLKMV